MSTFWNVAGLVGTVVGAAGLVALVFTGWRNYRAMRRELIEHFTTLRNQLKGMRWIILQREHAVFPFTGPRGLSRHFEVFAAEELRFDRLEPDFRLRVAPGLNGQMRRVEASARNVVKDFLRMAAPFLGERPEHQWRENDPWSLAMWRNRAGGLDHTIRMLDQMIANLQGTRLIHTIDPGQES